MSTLTHTGPTQVRATYVPTGSGLSFAGIIRSEWIKLWTVRSTPWSFALVILISLGMAAIMSFALTTMVTGGGPVPAGPAGAPALPTGEAQLVVTAATVGLSFGQLIVAVLGVLVISGEYATGMIKSTLTAVPRRLAALWAKAILLFVCTFVVGVISTIGAFLVASPILAGQGLHADLFDEAVILPLLGHALLLALISVFALGVGAILRSSAGGIATALGVIMLLPTVLMVIPTDWAADLAPYLLSNAGTQMISAATMEWWQGLLIVLGWVGASLVTAAVLLKRRDA